MKDDTNLTARLREWLYALGHRWSDGYKFHDGNRVNTDDVTQVPVNGHWVSVEESYDGTFTLMDMTLEDVERFLNSCDW